MKDRESIILAIDTSCDDTSASVVKNGREILSNIVSAQNEIHEKYGGIVPELASRKHIEIIWYVVNEALERASLALDDISAIAVCYGPGLIGSLIVGCSFAKSLSYAKGIPLVGVNHLEGHIYTPFLLEQSPEFPFISLVVSGGHTSLYRIDGFRKYGELGKTRDDAAGEAYDKVAKMLGLGYPGGPVIDRLARNGDREAVLFPRAYLRGTLDFSFSGLKTAVRTFLQRTDSEKHEDAFRKEDICASFQAAVVDVLIKKTLLSVERENIRSVAISGGVAANSDLREGLLRSGGEKGLVLFVPPLHLCTDNAAMIAAAGHFYYVNNIFADLSLNPKAYLPVGTVQ